jgi:ATP-dependent Clp protease ATP-binding subunit ClpB
MEEIIQIIDISLNELVQKLLERKIGLVVTEEAKESIASAAYSPIYGARPVKRYVQKNIETEIARKIIGGQLVEGSELQVDVKDDNLIFSVSNQE